MLSRVSTGATGSVAVRPAPAPAPPAPDPGGRGGGSVRGAGGRRAGATRRLALGPAAATLLVGLALLPAYRWGLGVDGVSYLSLAEHWAAGRLDVAVNAYWSPLLPLLVAPLVLVGVPTLLAGKLVLLAAAVGTVAAVQRLAGLLGAPPVPAAVAGLAAAPFALYAFAQGVFADGLLALLVVLYADALLRAHRSSGVRWALLAGVFAGLAALTKVYALPALLAHAALVGVVLAARAALTAPAGRRRSRGVAALLVPLAVGAAVLAVYGPWVVAMSASEGRPVVTSSARYNAAVAGPDSQGNVMRYDELIAPPHDDAVSIWEDPTAVPVRFGGFSDREAVVDRYLANVADTTGRYAEGLTELFVVPVVLGVAGLVVLVVRRRGADALALVALVGVMLGGYLPLFYEERYTWPPVALLLAASGLALAPVLAAFRAGLPPGRFRVVAGAVVVLVTLGTLQPLLGDYRDEYDVGRRTAEWAGELRDAGALDGPVASDQFWSRTAVLCFHAGCAFHGTADPDDDDLPARLRDEGIGTYVVWGDGVPSSLPGPRSTAGQVTAVDLEG